jgi:chemotaxis protein MotB
MKKAIFAVATVISILTSCGPGKKLQKAHSQIESLNNQLASLNGKITDSDKQIDQLRQQNLQYGKEAETCRKAKELIAQRLDNLNKNLEEQGTSLKQIQGNAAEALGKFKEAGADVTYKNGLVHITMQDKFLFASGSSVLSKDGTEALKVVSEVLQDNPKVSVIIVGNTDTDKVNGRYKDNWSLSTERANSVVRIFRDKYGLDPARLTSAGRSKYHPAIENTTAENKAKNRRIEIILNPDLSRLWELTKN